MEKGKEYELVPHEEIQKLKEELRNLREFEITPSKKMEISILDLNKKLDKLMGIFEKASHDLRKEEGGLTFTERMKPLAEKMNKILDQNAEIASGILAVADMIKPQKQQSRIPGLMPPPGMAPRPQNIPPLPPRTQPTSQTRPAVNYPPIPPKSGVNIRIPATPNAPSQNLPPPPPKKRSFGL